MNIEIVDKDTSNAAVGEPTIGKKLFDAYILNKPPQISGANQTSNKSTHQEQVESRLKLVAIEMGRLLKDFSYQTGYKVITIQLGEDSNGPYVEFTADKIERVKVREEVER